MKLFVQARKDGYNVLYPKPTPTEFFQFAGDIRRIDSNTGNFLGNFIYSIAYSNNGCIFTKHVIVQDVQRQGLGNVGFSVFIPNFKKLSGINIKSLLDELLKAYCENYCNDYYLRNVQEDWAIFEAIVNQYELRLQNHSTSKIANYKQGTSEAAFIYYSDDLELCNYFNAPFQEIFSAYKQVFFVEMRLKDAPENPLNAVRHDPNANLTGKVDLSIQKELKIVANDIENGDYITNFQLTGVTEYKEIHGDGMQLIFKNDDIYKSWRISIKHPDYETEYFDYEPIEFYEEICKKLKRKQHIREREQFPFTQNQKKYRIVIDENKGIRIPGLDIYPFVYEYPYFICKARFGYKFVGWKLVNIPNNGYTGDYEAVFNKTWYSKFSNWAWILLFSAIIAVSYILIFTKALDYPRNIQSKDLSQISNTINSYVFGIELNLDTLKKFNSSYCNTTMPASYNVSEKSFLQKFLPFISKNDESSSQQSQPLPDFCNRISNAIAMREAINLGQIDNLIGKAYSKEQEQFKMAIDSIDNDFKQELENILRSQSVSSMNLNEVAQLIRDKQNELFEERKKSQETIKPNETAKNQNQQRDLHEQATPSQQTNESSLEEEFWMLVKKTDTPQMNEYKHLLDMHYQNDRIKIPNPTDEERKIIAFLQEICQNSLSFRPYAKDIPAIDRRQAKSVAELRHLKNQKK